MDGSQNYDRHSHTLISVKIKVGKMILMMKQFLWRCTIVIMNISLSQVEETPAENKEEAKSE